MFNSNYALPVLNENVAYPVAHPVHPPLIVPAREPIAVKLRLGDDLIMTYIEIRRPRVNRYRSYNPSETSLKRLTNLVDKLVFEKDWHLVPQVTGWLAIERL